MEMDHALALNALQLLDEKLSEQGMGAVDLVVGGGASMILEYGYPGTTLVLDAVPQTTDLNDLRESMEQVARELGLNGDWLNPYFSAFTVYLPKDAPLRMRLILEGKCLRVRTLGPEDILTMKLMAGRPKDFGHIKHLLKLNLDLQITERSLESIRAVYPSEAKRALDRLDDFLGD